MPPQTRAQLQAELYGQAYEDEEPQEEQEDQGGDGTGQREAQPQNAQRGAVIGAIMAREDNSPEMPSGSGLTVIKLLEMLLPMFGDVMNLLNYAAKLLEAGNEGQRQVSAQLQELIDQEGGITGTKRPRDGDIFNALSFKPRMKRMLDINGSYPLQVIIDDLCDALNGGGNSEVKIVAWGQQMANKMRDWRSNEYLAAYKAAIKHNYAWIEEARAADAPVDATRFSQRRESKGPWANATFDAAAAARLKNGDRYRASYKQDGSLGDDYFVYPFRAGLIQATGATADPLDPDCLGPASVYQIATFETLLRLGLADQAGTITIPRSGGKGTVGVAIDKLAREIATRAPSAYRQQPNAWAQEDGAWANRPLD